MIRLAFSAFITGWFFANLQFSYLMLLQINISSAYLTYMLITLAWMSGAITGLWVPRLNMMFGVALGVVSYYMVALLLATQPFSLLTLPISAMGVALSGLWAGRFFVVMLDRFKTADRIFFHENNGFIMGGAAFFIGFTLLGRPFLMAMPLVLSGFLFLSRWGRERNVS